MVRRRTAKPIVWQPTLSKPARKRPADALVALLQADIDSGHLTWGDRLPPHRELARRLGIAVGTVSKACREAERRGLLSSQVGRGTFVCRPVRTRGGRNEGEWIDLAVNVPPPGIHMAAVAHELTKASEHLELLMNYHPHQGIAAHCEAAAHWFSSPTLQIDPSRLVLSNGAHNAIDIALRMVTNPGDAVLVEALTYSGFKAQLAANRLSPVSVEMDDDGLVPESLAAAAQSSGARVLYVMPTLHSPTGRTMSVARRQRISGVAEKFDLLVIEDDVYAFFKRRRPIELASLRPESTFYLSSFAKCLAPGFRLGTLVMPQRFMARAELLMHASCWMAPPILTHVAYRLIESGAIDSIVAEKRQEAAHRHALLRAAFANCPVEIEPQSEPGFFAWVRLAGDWTAMSAYRAFRANGIAVTPPDSSLTRGGEPGGIRLCIGAIAGADELAATLKRLAGIFDESALSPLSVA
jgi:DNA-binding transcriptional MocR family regulator